MSATAALASRKTKAKPHEPGNDLPSAIEPPAPASVAGTRKMIARRESPPAAPLESVIWDIVIEQISVTHNDRTEFDKAAIANLATSIAERGLDNAITVRKSGDGFELIAGERRMRACKSLGMLVVPARIIEADDKSADLLRLEENLLREDLNQIDRAAGIKRYIEKHGESQSVVGKRFGMTQAQVSNLLRLLLLPEVWQQKVRSGEIPHTMVRDVLCPWSHRPSLLEWVATEMAENYDTEDAIARHELDTLIYRGIQELTRSCRRQAYQDWQKYSAKDCCFKLDDQNRHALDVEVSKSGEERAWNIEAWENLNAPARKAYEDKQKKTKAATAVEKKSGAKGKKAEEAICDKQELKQALQEQLAQKLADAINPKKHAKPIVKLMVYLCLDQDLGDELYGQDRYGLHASRKQISMLAELTDATLAATFAAAVQEGLRSDFCSVTPEDLVSLAAILPVDLLHDWTPTAKVLAAYADAQLVAFAHDCEIDHTQSRLNLIIGLTKPGVWQAGHVPAEVALMCEGK